MDCSPRYIIFNPPPSNSVLQIIPVTGQPGYRFAVLNSQIVHPNMPGIPVTSQEYNNHVISNSQNVNPNVPAAVESAGPCYRKILPKKSNSTVAISQEKSVKSLPEKEAKKKVVPEESKVRDPKNVPIVDLTTEGVEDTSKNTPEDTRKDNQEKNEELDSSDPETEQQETKARSNKGVEVSVFPQTRGVSCENFNFYCKDIKRTRYFCIKRNCPCKLKKLNDGVWLKFNEHTCRPDDHKTLEEREFTGKAKEIMKEQSGLTPFAAFNAAEKEFPTMSTSTSYPLMRKPLQRVKRAQGPSTKAELRDSYKNIHEFGRHVEEHPEILTYTDTNDRVYGLKGKLIKSSVTGKHHFLLYDPKLMDEFDDSEIHLDGTFFSCPRVKEVKQLVTIMAKKNNESFPIAWILMSRRTVDDYNPVFETIKEMFPKFNPTDAHLDFEKGLRKSLKICFPGIKIWSCHFHFAQSLVRRCKKLGLCAKYDNKKLNPEAHAIMKKLIGLALLPAEKFEEGLIHVEKLAYALGKKRDAEREDDKKKPKFLAKWQKLFKYMRSEWLTKVKPINISVFSSPERTNNVLERYHRDINDEMGGKPGVKKFVVGLIMIKERSLKNVIRAGKGLPVHMTQSSLKWKVRDARIKNAMEHMKTENPWTVEKFLNEVSVPDWDPIFETIDQDDKLRGEEEFNPEEDSDWELDCDPESKDERAKRAEAVFAALKPSAKGIVAKTPTALPATAYEPPPEQNDTEAPRGLLAAAYEPPPEQNDTEATRGLPATAYEPPPEQNDGEAPSGLPADGARKESDNIPQQPKKPQKRSLKDDKTPMKKIRSENGRPKPRLIETEMFVPMYDEAIAGGQNGRRRRKPMWMTSYVVQRKKVRSKTKKQ